jgi:hypothetical protein
MVAGGGSKAGGANLGTEGEGDLVAGGSKAGGAICGAGGGGGMVVTGAL